MYLLVVSGVRVVFYTFRCNDMKKVEKMGKNDINLGIKTGLVYAVNDVWNVRRPC